MTPSKKRFLITVNVRLGSYMALVMLTTFAGCAHTTGHVTAHNVALSHDRCDEQPLKPTRCARKQIGRYGVRCRQRTTNVRASGRVPAIYSVSGIGEPGVPHLAPATLEVIGKIQRYIRSKTLSFAYPLGSLHAIVFDATHGPCAFMSYQVLNAPGRHNVFYNPGDDPTHVAAYPGDIPATPFPWMK